LFLDVPEEGKRAADHAGQAATIGGGQVELTNQDVVEVGQRPFLNLCRNLPLRLSYFEGSILTDFPKKDATTTKGI
jgi:hypothetical protein